MSQDLTFPSNATFALSRAPENVRLFGVRDGFVPSTPLWISSDQIIQAAVASATAALLGFVGPSGKGGTAPIPVTTTYTTSGVIAATDQLALINSTDTVAMSLADGTVDGYFMRVKRYGPGEVTVTARLDGVIQTVDMNTPGTLRECLFLRWLGGSINSWILE